MIKVIVFDFDGTLYNGWVWDGWSDYIENFLNKFFKSEKEKNEFLKNFVQGYEYLDERAICEGLIQKFGTSKPMLDYLENEFYPYKANNLKFISQDFLKNLAKTHHLYIVSNTPDKSVKIHLKNNGIDPSIFESVIYNACDKLGASKDLKFGEIMKKENVLPGEVLVVGDSYELDILPAKKLNMQTLLVRTLDDIYNFDFNN